MQVAFFGEALTAAQHHIPSAMQDTNGHDNRERRHDDTRDNGHKEQNVM